MCENHFRDPWNSLRALFLSLLDKDKSARVYIKQIICLVVDAKVLMLKPTIKKESLACSYLH